MQRLNCALFSLICRCSFISSPANCHRLQSHGCAHLYYRRGQCRLGLGRPRIPDHSSPAAAGSHGSVCGASSSAACAAVLAEATRIRREFLRIHDAFGDFFPAAGGRGERRRVVDGGRWRSGTVGIGRAEPEEEASEAGAC